MVSRFEYDKVGNKRFEWDIHGHRTEFVYDDLYRVVRKVLPEEPYEEEFAYDLGRKQAQRDGRQRERDRRSSTTTSIGLS